MVKPLVLALGLLAAAGGTAAGVYYALPGGEEEVVRQAQETATPTPAASPTQAPSPAATPTPTPAPEPPPDSVPPDWQTYTDPVLGFSLRYPPDLSFKDLTGVSPVRGQRGVEFRSAEDRARGFTIGILENPEGLSLERWVQENTACLPETIKQGSVGGKPAILCTSQPEKLLEAAVAFEHTGRIVYITSIMPSSEFELVLASFRS